MMEDITLPEVKALKANARFYRDGAKDFVETSYVGSKDTVVERVKPEHMAKFPGEWAAFCDGRPMERRSGIPLTDLPGINEQRADLYIQRNVHTLEELAVLSDAQCQGIGHGCITDRQGAVKLVAKRQFEAREAAQNRVREVSATIGPRPADNPAAPIAELTSVKADIAELKQSLASLVAALTVKQAQPETAAPESPADDLPPMVALNSLKVEGRGPAEQRRPRREAKGAS